MSNGSIRASKEQPPDEPTSGQTEIVSSRHCVDCSLTAPVTESTYTLMSPLHGWRFTLRVDKDGRRGGDWRCPGCYKVFRAAQK
jgi:hypothetical protein